MRILVTLLLALIIWAPAASSAADPVPGSLRVVIVPEGELLPSESRALAALKNKLATKPQTAALAEANAAEASFAAAAFTVQGAPPPLPKEWLASQVVLVLQVLAPSGKRPNRVSRGLGTVLLFRPPQQQPIYREVISGEAGSALTSEALPGWIARAITLSAQGGGK